MFRLVRLCFENLRKDGFAMKNKNEVSEIEKFENEKFEIKKFEIKKFENEKDDCNCDCDNNNGYDNDNRNFLIAVLNRNGVSRSLDKFGKPCLKIDPVRLPSIKLVRSYKNGRLSPDCLDNPTARLFYYDDNPQNSQSHFDFSLNDFFFAYQSAKYSENSTFDFLASDNSNENAVLSAIFDFYGLNECKVSKLSTQRRKPLKRLKIGVKIGKAGKLLDCYEPNRSNLNKINKNRKNPNSLKSLFPSTDSPDWKSLDSIVKAASINKDLSLFDDFIASFPILSKKNLDSLWIIFLNSVDKCSLSV